MVNPVLPSNTIAAGQSGHVADHNKITDAIQTVADAVTALEGNGSITTARLADSAVTSAKIADGTIATGDLADGAVTSAKIADGTIATADIADSAVTSAKIADGTIVNADVNASAAIDVSKLSGVVSSAQVGNLLTNAQASVESSLAGWGASGNLTLTYDATTAVYGSGSGLATTTAGSSGLNVSNFSAGSRLPVTAGRTYTLISHMRQAGGNTARTIIARFDWYDSATGGTFLGSVVSPATTSTSWVRQVATGVAPVGATHVSIFPLFFSNSGSIGDSANFDAVSFHEGAGGDWVLPGQVIPELGFRADAGGAVSAYNSTTGTWTPVTVADGAITNAKVNASAAIDVSKLSGVVSSATIGNLLTTAQASCESDVSVWNPAASTVTYDTTDKVQGSGSHLFTATTPWAYVPNMAARVPVTVGATYTASAYLRNVTGSRPWSVRLYFYTTATGWTLLSGPVSAEYSGTTWQRLSVTGVVPANGASNVAYAAFVIGTNAGGAVGDQVRIDAAGIWQGAGGQWTMPGNVISGLGSYWDETVGRRRFDWDTVNQRWQLTYSDTGWREILTFDATGTVTQGAFDAGGYWGPRAGQPGWVRVRRRNGMLHFWIRNVASANAAYLIRQVTALPAGFRLTDSNDQIPILALPASGNTIFKPTYVTGAYSGSVLSIVQTGAVDDYIPAQQVSIVNDAAWPTTLPGTAVGTIPNA